jgi:hypothetical protein
VSPTSKAATAIPSIAARAIELPFFCAVFITASNEFGIFKVALRIEFGEPIITGNPPAAN